MPISTGKLPTKAPLFVILSWFAPLFLFYLVLSFHEMERNLLRDALTRGNLDLETIFTVLRPHQFWLEAVSFTATMGIWVFAILFSMAAFRRNERVQWLAVPPFLFGLFILAAWLWVIIFHDPEMGYHVLFSPHESYETRIEL